jgi:hypothetical protein
MKVFNLIYKRRRLQESGNSETKVPGDDYMLRLEGTASVVVGKSDHLIRHVK